MSAQLTSGAKLDEILHGLLTAGILAASIFVKNPASRDKAGQIINILNGTLIPLADSLLNPATPAQVLGGSVASGSSS